MENFAQLSLLHKFLNKVHYFETPSYPDHQDHLAKYNDISSLLPPLTSLIQLNMTMDPYPSSTIVPSSIQHLTLKSPIHLDF